MPSEPEVHFDYAVNKKTYKPEKILKSLEKLRKLIKDKDRKGDIQYSIEVDPGIPLYYDKDKANVTEKNVKYVVTIDCKTLYPKDFQNGKKYTIEKVINDGKNEKRQKFELMAATYTKKLILSDLLAMEKNKWAMEEPMGIEQIFKILYEYIGSYQNWQSGQVDQGVKIVIPYINEKK